MQFGRKAIWIYQMIYLSYFPFYKIIIERIEQSYFYDTYNKDKTVDTKIWTLLHILLSCSNDNKCNTFFPFINSQNIAKQYRRIFCSKNDIRMWMCPLNVDIAKWYYVPEQVFFYPTGTEYNIPFYKNETSLCHQYMSGSVLCTFSVLFIFVQSAFLFTSSPKNLSRNINVLLPRAYTFIKSFRNIYVLKECRIIWGFIYLDNKILIQARKLHQAWANAKVLI